MNRLLIAGMAATLALSCSRAAPPPPPSSTTSAKPLAAGVEINGFDKTVRPQDDLYRHVNGAWLAKTQIPADRGAYGGFYEAIDRTQDQLRGIVEAAAKAPDKAPGSDEQKLGDFYTAFMDEARVNQLGKSPLEPELARDRRIATKTDLARHIARMMLLNVTTLIGGSVDGDAQDPDDLGALPAQDGLGLPDREYYLKDDAKLKEYRAKYLALRHQDADARRPAVAGGRGQGDPRARDPARARALDQRREPRRGEDLQQGRRSRTCRSSSPGSTGAPGAQELGARMPRRSIVAQPSYFKAMAATRRRAAGRSLEAVLKFHTANGLAPYLSAEFVEARFDFYGRTLQGVEGNAAALEARRQQPRHGARRAARQGLRRAALQAGGEGAHGAARREPPRGASARASTSSTGWGPETKKEAQAKLAAFRPKIGYPSKWRDYSKLEIKPDDPVGNMHRARGWPRASIRSARPASRSTPKSGA